MKTTQLKIAVLFGFLLFSKSLIAQNRQHGSYEINQSKKEKKVTNDPQLILPNTLSSYYFEGFENTFPPAGWQIIDQLDSVNTWISSSLADLPDAYEGAKSAHCQYAVPGPSGDDWLISPKFSVAEGDSLSFEFKLEYFGYYPDTTSILISISDSSTSSFTHLIDFYAEGLNYPADVNWHYKSYSLKQFEGKEIFVAFRNKNTLGDGIFIDNVELGTRPIAQAAVLKIAIPDFYPAGISKPKALIKNKGSVTQTILATMDISDGYTSSKSVSLKPQEAQLVEFDSWNAAISSFTINVHTFLSGDTTAYDDKLSVNTKTLEQFINYGWSIHEPLLTPTVGSVCASFNDKNNGKLFSIGGIIGTNEYTPDAYEYDLSFASWSAINAMPTATWQSASAISNGKIIVTGGESSSGVIATTQIYNDLTGKWSTGAAMPVATANMAFGTYKDSLLYIIGGRKTDGTFTNTVQIYNLFTNKWSNGTPKPGAKVSGLRGGISGNKIIITGGVDYATLLPISISYIGTINPQKPTEIDWIQTDDYPLDQIRFQGTAVSLDKSVDMVVFSGGTDTPVFSEVTNHTFAFDFNSNSWKLGPNKPTKAHYFNMTPIISNDSIYLAAIGGGDGSFQIDKNEWLNLGYYQIPTATTEVKTPGLISLSPNPFKDELKLILDHKTATDINISLIDVLGNTVYKQNKYHLAGGQATISLNTALLNQGIYFCLVEFNGSRISRVVTKF